MKTEITIVKVKARDIQVAIQKIKRKYPRAIIITYKFEKDFKFVEQKKRNYHNRFMKVAFIKDVMKIRDRLKFKKVN